MLGKVIETQHVLELNLLLPESRHLTEVCKIELLVLGPPLDRYVVHILIYFIIASAQIRLFGGILAALNLKYYVLVKIT